MLTTIKYKHIVHVDVGICMYYTLWHFNKLFCRAIPIGPDQRSLLSSHIGFLHVKLFSNNIHWSVLSLVRPMVKSVRTK